MKIWQYYSKELLGVFLIFVIKLTIITLLPITGDEAYFVKWSTHLSMGYYDHPPMVGWLIYLMSFINQDIIFYRLISVLTTLILAYIIYLFAKEATSQNKAFYLALIFLASPIDILMILFTNDIPLVLFGSIGAYLFFIALEKEFFWKLALASGVFLGLAFLSKYFSVLLVFSLYVFALISYGKKALKLIVVTALVILPFVVQNIYFNYNSCWTNIMFNFLSRPKASYDPKMIFTFLGSIIYIFTPWGLWMLRKGNFYRGKLSTLILSILTVAFGILLIVSLKNRVGLHWFLLFTPYIFLLFIYLGEEKLKKLFQYNFIFTIIHGVLLLTVLFLPVSTFEKISSYSSIIYAVETDKVCEILKPYEDNKLFTLGYTSAAMLSYGCNRNLYMLFSTSKYGRLDDKLVNINELDGENITVFNHKPIKKGKLLKACTDVNIDEIEIQKATFYLASCKNFDYLSYKKYFLDEVNHEFYNIPSWLPKGECYFKDRYYQ